MSKERPVDTLNRFVKTSDWIERSSLDALAGDLLVGQAESKLQWFTCVYEDRNGILYSPVMDGPIVGTEGGVATQNEFNNELQNWFLSNEAGLAVGISPKGGKFNHPDDQIQIYRIAYEWIKNDQGKIIDQKKSLLCAFHQFDVDYKNPEVVRRFLFPEQDTEEGIFEIINWLKKVSKKKVEDSLINHSENIVAAYNYARQLKNGVDPKYVFDQMSQTKFLGNNPIGCASTSITTSPNYYSNTTESYGYQSNETVKIIKCHCPICDKDVNASISGGTITCLSCGASATSVCV